MKQKFNSEKFAIIREKILRFNMNRGWNPNAHDIATSVVLESAELLELFQWSDSRKKLRNMTPETKEKVFHEVADILWYLFQFCEKMKIDINEALEHKIEHNENKYPVEMFAGKHNSEFYYQRKQEYRNKK